MSILSVPSGAGLPFALLMFSNNDADTYSLEECLYLIPTLTGQNFHLFYFYSLALSFDVRPCITITKAAS
jgi:hypothetical protein